MGKACQDLIGVGGGGMRWRCCVGNVEGLHCMLDSGHDHFARSLLLLLLLPSPLLQMIMMMMSLFADETLRHHGKGKKESVLWERKQESRNEKTKANGEKKIFLTKQKI